ncbi:MAG: DUF7133 domain-containing protein, partial [Opitutaceae bacterium]
VLIGDPPNLWLCRDRDGDGVADEKVSIANDYGTVVEVVTSPNGLLWGRDNWLYNASYKWRLRFIDGMWRREPMPELGQYGITQDDAGRLFYNRNSDQLRGDFLPSHYIGEQPRSSRFNSMNVQIATDQRVFPIRPTPGVNRGYRKDFLRDDGTLVAFTAASAPVVYRGAGFPRRYQGNVFVPAPGANCIKRNLLLEAEGRLTALNGFEQADFMASTDERFRPVFLANGPDGALYVADMYRGIIERCTSITSYLRDQILERGLNRPLWGMGRIYRVVYADGSRSEPPVFAQLTAAQRVALLEHANGWTRDTAQRVIVESGSMDCVAPLRELFASPNATERGRLYALWCLEGLGAVTPEFALTALADPAAKIRMAALRISEPWLGRSEGQDLLASMAGRIAMEEPMVLAQVLLSLSPRRTPATRAVVFAALPRMAEHPALLDAALLAIRGEEAAALDHLTAATRGRTLPPFGHRAIFQSFGAVIAHGSDRAAHERLVAALLDRKVPEPVRLALMQGAEPVMNTEARRQAAARTKLDPALLEKIASTSPDLAVRKSARAWLDIIEQEKARLAKRAPVKPLAPAERKWFEIGKINYLLCAGCHQPDGEGREGVAPSLENGRWAAHPSADFALRIVLQGKEGTPGFPGGMPPMSALSDDRISGILTYVRRSWGNEASAVSPADVSRVRAETKDRVTAWNDVMLENLKPDAK